MRFCGVYLSHSGMTGLDLRPNLQRRSHFNSERTKALEAHPGAADRDPEVRFLGPICAPVFVLKLDPTALTIDLFKRRITIRDFEICGTGIFAKTLPKRRGSNLHDRAGLIGRDNF